MWLRRKIIVQGSLDLAILPYATLHLLFTLTPYTRSNTSLYSSNLSFLLNMLMFMVKFGISLGKKIYDKHKFSCIRINTFFYYPHV